MGFYILDTDHLSLLQRDHPTVGSRVVIARNNMSDKVVTTVVSMEEQLKGRLAQINRTTDPSQLVSAYEQLKMTFALFADLELLSYGFAADHYFRKFRKMRIRIGTQDLRIASIALAQNGIVLTRNFRDFEKVPDLLIQDWSIEK